MSALTLMLLHASLSQTAKTLFFTFSPTSHSSPLGMCSSRVQWAVSPRSSHSPVLFNPSPAVREVDGLTLNRQLRSPQIETASLFRSTMILGCIFMNILNSDVRFNSPVVRRETCNSAFSSHYKVPLQAIMFYWKWAIFMRLCDLSRCWLKTLEGFLMHVQTLRSVTGFKKVKGV